MVLFENKNRDQRVAIRFTKEEVEVLKEQAELEGCSNISDYFRLILKDRIEGK